MSKVYITNRSSHDFSPAEHFGELVYLSDGEVSKFNTSKMFRQLSPVLARANAEDFLLPTSMSVISIIAAGILIEQFHKVNLLVFDAARNRYVARTVKFLEGASSEEDDMGTEPE
jgi:hypothetical protein